MNTQEVVNILTAFATIIHNSANVITDFKWDCQNGVREKYDDYYGRTKELDGSKCIRIEISYRT